MVAWMGWELRNARQDVDIREVTFNALKKIPLGSYVEGLVSSKGHMPQYKKVMTAKNYEERVERDKSRGRFWRDRDQK
jgi:hypothetical protein